MKIYNYQVVMQEFPGEFALAINISGCPNHCPDCHSQYLWNDIGEDLTVDSIRKLILNNSGITCVGFMGGDQDPESLIYIASKIHNEFPNLKLGWYSGKNYLYSKAVSIFDYIKIGPYIKSRGPLTSPSTNQVLLYIHDGMIENITNRFTRG